jgi:hypothetical protein
MRMYARFEGFRRISLGMLPIVTYTGYALLLWKTVTWVLSDEIITGITVRPLPHVLSNVAYSADGERQCKEI